MDENNFRRGKSVFVMSACKIFEDCPKRLARAVSKCCCGVIGRRVRGVDGQDGESQPFGVMEAERLWVWHILVSAILCIAVFHFPINSKTLLRRAAYLQAGRLARFCSCPQAA